MKIRYKFLLIFLCLGLGLNAQLFDDFSDGNLTDNPKWEGKTTDFRVNPTFQLQLNAAAAGESYIYTKYQMPEDSIEIQLYFKMTFDPSDNNLSKIYLFIDNPEEALASGYYLRLGENGANDNIKVFKLVAGVSTLLASGNMGAIARDPAQARMNIKVFRDGRWNIATNYAGGNILADEFDFIDPQMMLPDSAYFGIFCKYTSTRLTNFFYDDIFVKSLEKDTTSPVITKIEVLNDFNLKLTFSEVLDKTTAENINHYTLNHNLGKPKSAVLDFELPNIVLLTFNENIRSGLEYTLSISGVQDLVGNAKNLSYNFTFNTVPSPGDLILTEVLTDPYVGGQDFIEIYNNSTKFLILNNLIVRNSSRNEERIVTTDFILFPDQYVAISSNVDFLKTTYSPIDEANFIIATIPALNVSDANITLLIKKGNDRIVLDSFDYNQKMHHPLISATKGISLEKIRLNGATNSRDNWHSASQTANFATPGYKNSNFEAESNTDESITLSKKVFSPYSSLFDNFLLIDYNLEKSGYLATIKIFDDEGFLIKNLTNNLLLGNEGSIKWDGTNEDGKPVKTGLFVIFTQLLHTDGETKSFKHVAVVSDQF